MLQIFKIIFDFIFDDILHAGALIYFFSNEICFVSFVVFDSVVILHTSVLQDFISVSDFFAYFVLFFIVEISDLWQACRKI